VVHADTHVISRFDSAVSPCSCFFHYVGNSNIMACIGLYNYIYIYIYSEAKCWNRRFACGNH
jgi:hypothetical protein